MFITVLTTNAICLSTATVCQKSLVLFLLIDNKIKIGKKKLFEHGTVTNIVSLESVISISNPITGSVQGNTNPGLTLRQWTNKASLRDSQIDIQIIRQA